jgi:hypothetical protein
MVLVALAALRSLVVDEKAAPAPRRGCAAIRRRSHAELRRRAAAPAAATLAQLQTQLDTSRL